MHCCASSAAKEEALIPWKRNPSGRLQSQQKSEFRRTTDLPCHANTVQIGARSGKIGSSSIYNSSSAFEGELWYGRSDQVGQPLRSHCFSLSPFRTPLLKHRMAQKSTTQTVTQGEVKLCPPPQLMSSIKRGWLPWPSSMWSAAV